jgi:hypothetical protein
MYVGSRYARLARCSGRCGAGAELLRDGEGDAGQVMLVLRVVEEGSCRQRKKVSKRQRLKKRRWRRRIRECRPRLTVCIARLLRVLRPVLRLHWGRRVSSRAKAAVVPVVHGPWLSLAQAASPQAVQQYQAQQVQEAVEEAQRQCRALLATLVGAAVAGLLTGRRLCPLLLPPSLLPTRAQPTAKEARAKVRDKDSPYQVPCP